MTTAISKQNDAQKRPAGNKRHLRLPLHNCMLLSLFYSSTQQESLISIFKEKKLITVWLHYGKTSQRVSQ